MDLGHIRKNRRKYYKCATCEKQIFQFRQCRVCYFRGCLERYKPLDILLKECTQLEHEHAIFKKKRNEISDEAETFLRNMPLWKKILINKSDGNVKRLYKERRQVNGFLYQTAGDLITVQRDIKAVREHERKLRQALRSRAETEDWERVARKESDRFRNDSLSVAGELDYNRHEFIIRKVDYKRGNKLENYVRNDLSSDILRIAENKCINCGLRNDLTFDHFGIPKNEGGNFLLFTKNKETIKANLVVLCRKCNSAKGEDSHLVFFRPEVLERAVRFHEKLVETVLNNKEAMLVVLQWYS
ncbi:MAG: HNH endonuclease [Bacteroidales bacterium]|nr:HNH endonuclease [Candidatus Latescibacterota bacterium]